MATRTSSQAGNWSSTSTWGGAAAPGNGDQAIIGHAVTLDADKTVGASNPSSPITVRPTLSAVAGGGSLAAGTYYAYFVEVDGAGKVSGYSQESASQAITAGQTLRISMGALPTGVVSRKVFITSVFPTLEKLYATGITTATYDMTSAQWTDGTTSEAAADVAPNAFAVKITTSGSLDLNGHKLTCRGDMLCGIGAAFTSPTVITGSAGSWLFMDTSACNSPANVNYAILSAIYQGNPGITLTGSSGSHCKISSDAGGGAAYFYSFQQTNTGSYDIFHISLTYTDVTKIGDTVNDATPADSDTFTLLANVVFDGCGTPTGGGNAFSFTNVTTKNTNSRTFVTGFQRAFDVHTSRSGAASGKIVSGCTFDKRVRLAANATRYTNNVFAGGIDNGDAGSNWDLFDQCSVATLTWNSQGDVTNAWLYNPRPDSVDYESKTVASATTTVLTFTAPGWTAHQWELPSPGSPNYFVEMVGGACDGECRSIKTNTTTTLTVEPPFSGDCSGGVAKIMKQDGGHLLYAAANTTVSGAIIDNLGADHGAQGADGIAISASGITVTGCILLPNLGGISSSTLVTAISGGSGGIVNHNTLCCSSTVIDNNGVSLEGISSAGVLASVRSNLYRSVYGSFAKKISDLTSTLNAVTVADYNWGFGMAAGTSGNGYNVSMSGSPGAHDGSGDPQLAAPGNNLVTFGITLGFTGRKTAIQDKTIAAMLAINIPADANYKAGATLAAFFAHVRAGQVPANAALFTAAHDGTTIGAIQVDVTPPTVTAKAINAAGTTLTLTFSEAVTGVAASDYALTGAEGAYTLSAAAGSGTSWTMTVSPAVQGGETCTLDYSGIGSIDAASNLLATFSGASVTNNSTQAPRIPTGVNVATGSSQTQVIWNARSVVTTFRINRGLLADHSDTAEIGSALGNATTYNDTTTTTGVHYYYRVKARNSFGDSAFVDVDGIAEGPLSAGGGTAGNQRIPQLSQMRHLGHVF